MSAKIIDGKAIAREVRSGIRARALTLADKKNLVPGLTVIMVGDNPASAVYVRNKARACADVGINSNVVKLDAGTSEAELIARIEALNADPAAFSKRLNAVLEKGI